MNVKCRRKKRATGNEYRNGISSDDIRCMYDDFNNFNLKKGDGECMNPLMLWNIIEWCAKGGYVGGETFMSDKGHEIYFDGQRLVGIEKAEIKSIWHYVGTK